MGESKVWERYRMQRGLPPIPDETELFKDGDSEDHHDARAILKDLRGELTPPEYLALRRVLAEAKRLHEGVKKVREARADSRIAGHVEGALKHLTPLCEILQPPGWLTTARDELLVLQQMLRRPRHPRGAPRQDHKKIAYDRLDSLGFVTEGQARTLLRAIGFKFAGPRVS